MLAQGQRAAGRCLGLDPVSVKQRVPISSLKKERMITPQTQYLLKLALDVMLYVPGKYNSQGLRAN